ncbi:UvrD-helicase domain-containing protein [Idiomarina sp.]|uniref:UvrD-helicase domain-containing protein n=1 Tax=Idiomarina sp. TaxID=1874361 RepID=UPI002628554B|nr:UvrD-helicase domain-containing protein [Idiomarina sp.]
MGIKSKIKASFMLLKNLRVIQRPTLLKLTNENEQHYKKIKHYQKTNRELRDFLRSLKAEHQQEVKKLERQVSNAREELLNARDQHSISLAQAHKEYCNLITEYCERHNLRSPFEQPPKSEPIVQKEFFRFSETKKALFLNKLKDLGITPNDEQEAMLFSENPATCVQAGAGSGKSTMLAARVAFLHIEHGIPLDSITVTTFTRESRREFVEKLIKNINTLSSRPQKIDEAFGRTVVRTFHSIAYKVNKAFGGGRRIIFDKWTPFLETEDGEEIDIEDFEELSEDERRKKYTENKDIPQMPTLMVETYKSLYTHNEKFRQKIDFLFNESLRRMSFNQKSKPKTEPFYSPKGNVEGELSRHLLQDWISINPEYHSSLVDKFPPGEDYFVESDLKKTQLKYHLYLPKQKVRVFLSPNTGEYEKKKEFNNYCNSGHALSTWILWRKIFVHFKASNNYVWVDSKLALERLIEREDEVDETLPPPHFSYACVGEYAKKSPSEKGFTPIYAQFFEFSNFVYSLGRSVCELELDKKKRFLRDVPPADINFLSAAILFIGSLEKRLEKENVITFEQIFHYFKDENHPGLANCSPNQLAWCEHLLIDEFQDISPNIINFLNNIKKLYTRKSASGSIMFVGDGNQSIYVWRGSSYLYIKSPDDFFPVPGRFSILPLRNNYRSAEKVIDMAKIPLTNLGTRDSVVPARDDLDSMECHLSIRLPKEVNKDKSIDYDALAKDLLKEVNRVQATKDNPVYVLFKNHSQAKNTGHREWDTLFQSLTKSEQIKPLTIHTSKGLESRSVFILGDIPAGNWNPLKSAIYNLCDIQTSYQEAQNHEANCLCYVAITRAENNVYWYLNNIYDNGLANAYLTKWSPIVS